MKLTINRKDLYQTKGNSHLVTSIPITSLDKDQIRCLIELLDEVRNKDKENEDE